MDAHIFLTIFLMAFSTYLTRILGFLVLRNRKLSPTTERSMQVVGVILVVAMLIAPGIIGLTLTQSFDKMLLIATLSACTASLLGVILSYHFNASTGASIILIQAVFFLAALAYWTFP